MKAAVACYHDRVAPRLEHCTHLVLIEIRAGEVISEERFEARRFTPEGLAGLLHSESVSRLVCGGILHWHEEVLRRKGVEVIWGIVGRTDDAILALAEGTLTNDQFLSHAHARK
jgi:predicted Fe-Mo cluster-binding NifX family protein